MARITIRYCVYRLSGLLAVCVAARLRRELRTDVEMVRDGYGEFKVLVSDRWRRCSVSRCAALGTEDSGGHKGKAISVVTDVSYHDPLQNSAAAYRTSM